MFNKVKIKQTDCPVICEGLRRYRNDLVNQFMQQSKDGVLTADALDTMFTEYRQVIHLLHELEGYMYDIHGYTMREQKELPSEFKDAAARLAVGMLLNQERN